jgi:hypothetical protein
LAGVKEIPSPVEGRVVDLGVVAKTLCSLKTLVVGHIEGHLAYPDSTLLKRLSEPFKVPLAHLMGDWIVEGVLLAVRPVDIVPATGINPSGALHLVSAKACTIVTDSGAIFTRLDDGNFLQKAVCDFVSLCLDAQGK